MSTNIYQLCSKRAVARTCALAAAVAVLAGPTGAANLAQGTVLARVVSGSKRALTCFAVDVSGSNTVSTGGEPPTDPGPVFVRQQVVQLYDEVLTDLGEATAQQVAAVTFGTSIGTELGPVALSDTAARSRLEGALAAALRPSPAEAAWTSWVAGVDGCSRILQRSGATSGMVIVLTDGYPQGPAGGPVRQLAAIAPTAQRLWTEGIAIQPVLYGAGAAQQGSARQAMSRLAVMGHGQLVLAATPLDMLRSAVRLASLATGLPLGGTEVPVDGGTSVPLDLPTRVATAVLIVLRSSDQLEVSLTTPGAQPLSSLAAGAGGPGLVAAFTRPTAGTYQARAEGQGSIFAAELLRLDAVRAASTPAHAHRTAPVRHIGKSSSDLIWELALGLGALAGAAAAVAGWLIASRRRPKGILIVSCGSRSRCVDPVDLDEPVDLTHLLPGTASQPGWTVHWNRRAPVLIGPDNPAVSLVAEESKTVGTAPPTTLTWFPEGIDTSLSGEPPGRPIGADYADPTSTIDRS